MKKLFLTAILAFLVTGVYAQKKVLKSAEKAFKKGSLEEATTLAKQAAGDAETQDNPDVYSLLGQIEMQKYVDSEFKDIDAATASYDWFKQAMEKADDKGKEDLMEAPIFNPTDNSQIIGGGKTLGLLDHYLVTTGNNFIGEEMYAEAYPSLVLSNEISPSVQKAFFVAYGAQEADNIEVALDYYERVTKYDEEFNNMGFSYQRLIQLNQDNDNVEAALKFIRAAKERFPEEKYYASLEVDVLINNNMLEEATANIQAIIDAGNGTKETYYTLAYLQWNGEQLAEAEASALKALELDPDYTDALYVAGSVIFNQGAEIMTAANQELDDDEKYNELKNQAHEKFKQAIPYFEKAVVDRPEDKYLLQPMSTIYDQLGMDEKRDAVLAKLDEIEAAGGDQ